MSKTYIVAFVIAVFFVFGCSKKEKPALLQDFSMSQYIDSYFTDSIDIHLKIKHREILSGLYEKNQNKPFWFTDNQPNRQSEQLMDVLANSMNYGLDTTLYHLSTIRDFRQGLSPDSLITNQNKQSMLAYELGLTQSAISFFIHLNRGIMPFDPLSYITTAKIDSTSSYFKIYNYFDDFAPDSLINILQNAFQIDSLQPAVDRMQPQNAHYKRLQKALEGYVQNNPINQDSIQVVYYEQDTVWTSSFENYRKGCLALQKLRWSNISAKNYIFINIPAFTLDFVEKNTWALSHKIICGTPENQTPELNSRLKQIRLFPEWNVPFTIATKEILPIVKKNTNYLTKNHYEVLDRNGNLLHPDSVQWKKYTETNFPLRIRQTSGYHNSLGVILFYFDNSSAVYFHDTPAKRLFNQSFRAFSHGCMRMQNPFSFAKTIMEFDGGDTSHSEYLILQNKLQAKERHFYNVKKSIPIYIRYLTAYCNEENQICFAPDFYGRDAVLTVLFDKIVKELGDN